MPQSVDTLRGRTALVTGAAHRVGKGIAERLAAAGADLWIHYGSSEGAAVDCATELQDTHGATARAIRADLSDPAAIDRMFGTVGRSSGRLDILVNSAASFESSPFSEVDAATWDRTQTVNLRAPHLCARAAQPLLEAAAEERNATSSVINIADLSGVVPWRHHVQHGVSKAGLLHWTRIAALELAPRVRVNAVVPGAILPPTGGDPEAWEDVGKHLPLRRSGNPEDVGNAVAFLAAAEFITGEILFVDGGEHLYGSNKR